MATGAMAHAHEAGYGHETNPVWARDEAEKRGAARRARDALAASRTASPTNHEGLRQNPNPNPNRNPNPNPNPTPKPKPKPNPKPNPNRSLGMRQSSEAIGLPIERPSRDRASSPTLLLIEGELHTLDDGGHGALPSYHPSTLDDGGHGASPSYHPSTLDDGGHGALPSYHPSTLDDGGHGAWLELELGLGLAISPFSLPPSPCPVPFCPMPRARPHTPLAPYPIPPLPYGRPPHRSGPGSAPPGPPHPSAPPPPSAPDIQWRAVGRAVGPNCTAGCVQCSYIHDMALHTRSALTYAIRSYIRDLLYTHDTLLLWSVRTLTGVHPQPPPQPQPQPAPQAGEPYAQHMLCARQHDPPAPASALAPAPAPSPAPAPAPAPALTLTLSRRAVQE